jgi:predicted MFS family arabinose efflux permease
MNPVGVLPEARAAPTLTRLLLPLQAGALIIPLAGTGMVTLVPRLAQIHGISVGEAGFAITAYMVPFALAQLFSGGVAQRFTPRYAVTAGYATFIAGSFACAASPTFSLFLVSRFVQGLGAAFQFPVLMALVGEVVPSARLGRGFGVFQATQMLGMTLGPLVAGLLEVHAGWRWFFVTLGLLAALATAGFVYVFGSECPSPPARGSVLTITLSAVREPGVIMLSLSGAGLFFSMVGTNTYLAAWLKQAHGLGEDLIGLALGVFGAVGIPTSAAAGRWADRFGRRTMAVWGMLGYSATILALAVLPYTFAAVLAVVAALGTAVAIAWTSLNTLAVEALPELRHPAASIYNAFRFFGYSLAPPLLGLIYREGRALGVYLTCAAVVAASAICVGKGPLPKRD